MDPAKWAWLRRPIQAQLIALSADYQHDMTAPTTTGTLHKMLSDTHVIARLAKTLLPEGELEYATTKEILPRVQALMARCEQLPHSELTAFTAERRMSTLHYLSAATQHTDQRRLVRALFECTLDLVHAATYHYDDDSEALLEALVDDRLEYELEQAIHYSMSL